MWKSFPGIICNTITLRLLQYYLILNEKKLPIQFQKNVSPFNGSMLLRTFAGIVYEQCFCAMQHVHPTQTGFVHYTLSQCRWPWGCFDFCLYHRGELNLLLMTQICWSRETMAAGNKNGAINIKYSCLKTHQKMCSTNQ